MVRLSQNSESRKNSATLLVLRLRLGTRKNLSLRGAKRRSNPGFVPAMRVNRDCFAALAMTGPRLTWGLHLHYRPEMPSIGIPKSNREKEENLVATSRAERGIARHS